MMWGELREGIEFRCGRGGSSLENGGFPVRRETMILARIAVVAEVVIVAVAVVVVIVVVMLSSDSG